MKRIYFYCLFSLILALGGIVMMGCEKTIGSDFNKISAGNELLETRAGIKIVFGTRSHPCGKDAGCYCEGDRGVCLIIEWKLAVDSSFLSTIPNEGIADVELLPGNKIKFNMLKDNSVVTPSQNLFYVNSNYSLNGLFGSNKTIKAGTYSIDYSTNSLGVIVMDLL